MHVHVFIHAKDLTLLFSPFRIWQRLKPKDKKNGERDKKKNNLEEYWKNELDQVNAYKRKQNKTEFHIEYRDANHQWREAKRINNDNQTNHTPSESSTSTKTMSSQSLGNAMKRLKRVLPKSPSNP